MDTPKALNNIRAGLPSSDHQVGCNTYFFFHKDTGGWRNDFGVPEQVSMTGSIIQFYFKLKDDNNTPATSEPLQVNLDVTKIDHVIEWDKPGRDTAREGYEIEIDFDKGYEEIAKRGFSNPSARPVTQHTLYCGIARESSSAFLAAIRYLNPGASFIAAR